MKNLKLFSASLLLISVSAHAQYLGSGPEFLERDFTKQDLSVPYVNQDLVIDNALGLEIGMIQVLDVAGKLYDAAIVRCEETRIDLRAMKMPAGDYVLIFNTMLGFSFSQEVMRAEF